MKNIFYILLFLMISCAVKSQETMIDLSTSNISHQEKDKQTDWKRTLLNNPHKWGFVNDKNEIKIPFEYDFLNPFENGLAYAKKDGEEFFITIRNLKLDGNYDAVDIFGEGRAAVKKNGKWGFINEDGKLAIPLKYDEIEYFRPSGLCAVTIDGKSGFIDVKGKEIIPIIYEEAYQHMQDENVIIKKNGKWAVFNNKGKQLTDFIYDNFIRTSVTDFSKDVFKRDRSTFFANGAGLAQRDGRYEFLNLEGILLYPNLKIDSATAFDTFENAIIKSNGKYGIMKIDGTFKVPLEYDFIEYFDDNHSFSEYYNARKGKVYSIFNRDLKKIGESFEPVYNDFSTNTPTLIFKNLYNKYGMVASNGDLIIPFNYDELYEVERTDYFIVSKLNKFGIIDMKGSIRIPINYKSIYQLYGKFDEVELQNKLYYVADENKIVDINNNIIISEYDTLEPIFTDHNKLIVSKDGKFGIIDINKEIILPLEYNEVWNKVEHGPRHSTLIVKNSKIGLIDHNTFKISIQPIYDEFNYVNEFIFVKKEGKAGIINEEGKILCDFIYDEIYPNLFDLYSYGAENLKIYSKKGNSYFQINVNGKVLKSNLTKEFVKINSEIRK